MFGALLEVELPKICTTPARGNDLEIKIVKAPGARDVFWGWKSVSRGRRRDFDTLQNTWQAQEFVRVAKMLAGVGDLKRVGNGAFCVAGAVISRSVMSMFEASDAESVGGLQISCYGSVTSQGSFRVAVTGLRMPGLNFFVAGAVLLKRPLKNRWNVLEFWGQVSGQYIIFEGSLAEMLRFWASKLHFWRKSRRNASFLSFNASILKEVSQKCFVFELHSFIFEGSLAEKLRFWASQLQFWRKSRRKASFLSFKVSFLKEVSQKSFVFEFQSFIFEGSLAEMLRFWASKLRFWRKSRRRASFDKNHLNHTSVDNQITWTSNHLTSKPLESQINWQPTHLNLTSIDNQITWISDQLTTESLESQINWQPHHLKFTSTDHQNHLNHTSVDNQLTGISDQLTTKSLKPQTDWQPNRMNLKSIWQPPQLKFNSTDNQNHLKHTSIDTQNCLNLRSDDNQIIWLSTRLNLTSIDFRTTWTPHTLFL